MENGGNWVISKLGGVVPAITGALSRNPALHQELPIKQASPKVDVPAKNLVTSGFLAVAR